MLSPEQANTIFDILVTEADAPEWQRDDFVFTQTVGRCDEWRFMGSLGAGGKFYRSGGRWYVSAYSEDIEARPERSEVITRTNIALDIARVAKED